MCNCDFTKWVQAYPRAKTIVDLFVHPFISRFGVPDSLHTDQGSNIEEIY